MKIHRCECCNYETDRLSNYKKHLTSKKHKKNEQNYTPKNGEITPKNGGTTPKNGGTGFKCSYCKKQFKYKNHKARHLRSCKVKVQKELEEKNKLLEKRLKIERTEREKEKLERLRYEQKTIEMEAEKNEILNRFNEYLMKLWDERTKPQIVNIQNNNTINIDTLTIGYVRKHFNDAHNYEDLMNPTLSNNEIQLIEQSPINGCYELIKGRCIDNIELEKRPIHLVDHSRKKYVVRKDGKWITDIKGELILKEMDKKAAWIIKRYDLNNKKQLKTHMGIMDALLNDKYKVLEYLNDDVLLKDNAKLISG